MILTDKLRILRLISEQPFEEQEAEVLWRLCQEGGLYTERLIERLGLSQIVLLLSQWHARFRKSLSPALSEAKGLVPPHERGLEPHPTVLCAFTSVLDRVVDQAGLNRLLPWAAEVMGLSPEEFLGQAARRAKSGRNSRGGSLSTTVHDPLDVVAALLYFFRHPPALKPVIGNLTLRHQLEAFLAELPPGQLRHVLGGASAVAADILAELGVKARFYTMYHSPAQARRHGPLARRLDLEPEQNNEPITYRPAQRAGTYHPVLSPSPSVPPTRRGEERGRKGGTNSAATPLDHPTASSIAFVYQAGFTLDNAQADTTNFAVQADGVIFRRAPRGERPWDRVRLHPTQGQAVDLSAPEAGDEWLWLPGFVHWWVEGSTLHLAFADEETVRRIAADHHYLILSGLSPATFTPGEGAFDPSTGSGRRRLGAESQQHPEPCPERSQRAAEGQRPEPCPERSRRAAEGLAARELTAQMRSLAESGVTLHLELGSAAPEETIAPLAEAIGGLVPSAGINDNELTLLTSLSDFRAPVSPHRSAVFQRYQRAVALAQRLGLQRLYIHGNDVDLILRQDGSPEAMCREIEADLFAKGVVVLAILQRSLEDWPSHAIQLAPVLLWRGFQSLIAFAWDLVDQRGQDEALFKELIETGYALADSPQGYAVAVVPVMWPGLPPGIYPGGAGDICSSISLVHSGF